jgi:hypothetical protein
LVGQIVSQVFKPINLRLCLVIEKYLTLNRVTTFKCDLGVVTIFMTIFLIFTALHFPVIFAGEFTGSIVTLKERLSVNVELAKMCKGAGPTPQHDGDS